MVEDAEEGGFIARALGEGIFTEAETVEELRLNIKEAVTCYFDDNDENKPKIIRMHMVKQEVFAV